MGEHPPLVGGQQVQQVKLPAGQLQLSPVVEGAAGHGVNQEGCHIDNGVPPLAGQGRSGGVVAPEQGLGPHKALPQLQGLFHKIVRAHVKGPLSAFNAALGGQRQNGHILHLPHEADQLQSFRFRKGDVQDHKLVILPQQALDAVHDGKGVIRADAVLGQGVLDGLAVGLVAVDDQNPLFHIQSTVLLSERMVDAPPLAKLAKGD